MDDAKAPAPPPHQPHVLPLAIYLEVFAALVALTAITFAVSFLHLGPANLFVALLVASIKGALVALIFMHLYWDAKFNAIILTVGVLFVAIFLGITLLDTTTRGRSAEERLGDRPADVQHPFNGTVRDRELRQRYPGTK